MRLLLDRGVSGCPRVCYSVVDVRDVAAAAAKAIELDTVAGQLILLNLLHFVLLLMRSNNEPYETY